MKVEPVMIVIEADGCDVAREACEAVDGMVVNSKSITDALFTVWEEMDLDISSNDYFIFDLHEFVRGCNDEHLATGNAFIAHAYITTN